MSTRPISMSAVLKIRLSSLHKTEPPVCEHMLLQLFCFTQNHLSIDQFRKCMHSYCVQLFQTEIQIINEETLTLLDIIETIYYRTSYKN